MTLRINTRNKSPLDDIDIIIIPSKKLYFVPLQDMPPALYRMFRPAWDCGILQLRTMNNPSTLGRLTIIGEW